MTPETIRRLLGCVALAAAIGAQGCGGSAVSNSNSTAASGATGSNSNAVATVSRASTPNVLEPERYFVNITATLEGKNANAQPLSFSFAKLGTDKRWSLQSSQSPVTYLEKSGLKYLVFPALGQYVEIIPGEAGFQPEELMTPNLAWTRLKSRPAEKLGVEPVNGRTAIKYSFRTAGSEKSEYLLVDQETGLAIRSELSPTRDNEATDNRLILDARDLQLNPDSRQFDVPSGLKKVTAEQLKPQIKSLVESLRVYSVFY
jgi:hypothetical protein